MANGGGVYPRPQLRASRMLRIRGQVRRVPRTVDLSTWAEPRFMVTGYELVPKAEPAPASLLRTIRLLAGGADV